MYGIHLYKRGCPPVERRTRSDDRVNLYSVAKTFTSVALGRAEADGRLTLDDRLSTIVPNCGRSRRTGSSRSRCAS